MCLLNKQRSLVSRQKPRSTNYQKLIKMFLSAKRETVFDGQRTKSLSATDKFIIAITHNLAY